MTLAQTGPADLRDQRWLDERIEAIGDGIESVLDIARNWTDGRTLSRLHPDVSAKDYVLSHVKHPLGEGVVTPLLVESNWSNRQIAEIAGVGEATVRRTASDDAVERPAETLGGDGKLRPSTRPTPIGPRLDPTPDPYFTSPRVVRTVTTDVIDTPTTFRVIAQAFERDARHLFEGYRTHLADERFAARFGSVMAAIEAALGKGET